MSECVPIWSVRADFLIFGNKYASLSKDVTGDPKNISAAFMAACHEGVEGVISSEYDIENCVQLMVFRQPTRRSDRVRLHSRIPIVGKDTDGHFYFRKAVGRQIFPYLEGLRPEIKSSRLNIVKEWSVRYLLLF